MKQIEAKKEYEPFLKSPENKDKLIVIDFYADWCGPCRKMAPVVKKLQAKYPEVVFAKVDCDEAEDLAEYEDVEAMPTFIFYKNGDKVHRFCGSNEKDLEDKIKEYK